MKRKGVLPVLVVGALLLPIVAEAQEARAPESRWSMGVSLTYHIVRIYPVHVNYRHSERSEVFFGPAYQGWESGNLTADGYTLLLGYRHYLWRNFHAELELWPAWNRLHSSVTDARYPGWELWAEPKIGYKLNLGRNLYLHPNPGIGFGIFRTNRPPGFADEVDSPIFVPQLILGWRF
jgi:hypothetical protein